MKLFLTFLMALICVTFILGCGQAYEKKLPGGYWLWALDSRDDMSLMIEDGKYRVNIVSPTVTAYYVQENMIVVVQVNEINKPFSDGKRYFIIPLKDKISTKPEKNIIGPLNYSGFSEKVKEFNPLVDLKLDSKNWIKF